MLIYDHIAHSNGWLLPNDISTIVSERVGNSLGHSVGNSAVRCVSEHQGVGIKLQSLEDHLQDIHCRPEATGGLGIRHGMTRHPPRLPPRFPPGKPTGSKRFHTVHMKASTILHYIPPHIDCTNTGFIHALLRRLDVLQCLVERNMYQSTIIYPGIAKSKWLSMHLADFSNRLCTRDLLARQGILETRGGTPLVAALGSTVSWRH